MKSNTYDVPLNIDDFEHLDADECLRTGRRHVATEYLPPVLRRSACDSIADQRTIMWICLSILCGVLWAVVKASGH